MTVLKDYLIKSYAYLVEVGVDDLSSIEGSTKEVVPEEYREAVAKWNIEKNGGDKK